MECRLLNHKENIHHNEDTTNTNYLIIAVEFNDELIFQMIPFLIKITVKQ
jgi:hypothetical protein